MTTMETATKADEPTIRQLYREAFPRSERKPFWLIRRKAHQGIAELLVVRSDGAFAGLVVTLLHGDLVLLDYFAIKPECRGQGLGGQTLALLRERYAGRRIVLEIEPPDEASDNAEQRARRKAFYLRHGFSETGIGVRLFGVVFALLCTGGDVGFREYEALLRRVFGRWMVLFLRRVL